VFYFYQSEWIIFSFFLLSFDNLGFTVALLSVYKRSEWSSLRGAARLERSLMTGHSWHRLLRFWLGNVSVKESLLIIAENRFMWISSLERLMLILCLFRFSRFSGLRRALSVLKFLILTVCDFRLRADQDIGRLSDDFSISTPVIFIVFFGVIWTNVFVGGRHTT